MSTDAPLTDAEKILLTREAGTGLPPSIVSAEAMEFYNARCDDARWLADHGIQLALPEASRFVETDMGMLTIEPPPPE